MTKSILMKLYQLTEPWFSVVDPGTFALPEPRFHEETGPVNFTPNSSILGYFVKLLETVNHSVIDVLVRETNRYVGVDHLE
jgi:hypothetical protein